jgi:hypothetical protein
VGVPLLLGPGDPLHHHALRDRGRVRAVSQARARDPAVVRQPRGRRQAAGPRSGRGRRLRRPGPGPSLQRGRLHGRGSPARHARLRAGVRGARVRGGPVPGAGRLRPRIALRLPAAHERGLAARPGRRPVRGPHHRGGRVPAVPAAGRDLQHQRRLRRGRGPALQRHRLHLRAVRAGGRGLRDLPRRAAERPRRRRHHRLRQHGRPLLRHRERVHHGAHRTDGAGPLPALPPER